MIRIEKVDYYDSQNTYEGVIAYDDNSAITRPVILIAHAFGGRSKFEEDKAVILAELGYVGFAIDLYGKGKGAKSPEEARKLMDFLNSDRKMLLERMKLCLEQAKKIKFADKAKIGAIGFCFGGKCVLDLARSGETLSGIVCFHGLFDAPKFSQDTKIVAPILVLHGWEDPLALPDDTLRLANELTSKEADWEINVYGNTGHAFTNPKARFPEKGLMYKQSSSDKAWNRMKAFFDDVFYRK